MIKFFLEKASRLSLVARLELEDNGAGIAVGMYLMHTVLPEQN